MTTEADEEVSGDAHVGVSPQPPATPTSDVPAIEVAGVAKRFGQHVALEGVDLRIRAGEFVTLFGPNGAGKTTLVRCVATLARASEGTVALFGTPLQHSSPDLRRHVGVVSHASFLYGALTARENLLFYGGMFGVSELADRVDAVLEQVDLLDRGNDPVRTFSRGLLQRCAIARALVHDPEILLFDEPFSGLDPTAADTLYEILRGAHRRQRTVLMTSHDLRRGHELADRIVVLRYGNIVHDASAAGVGGREMEQLYHQLIHGDRA